MLGVMPPTQILLPRMGKVVNVGQVPQYSPFRYPGGKSWFAPRLRKWLSATKPDYFVEPFAGGASASCTVLLEGWAKEVVLNELDPQVCAVWQVVFSSDAHELCRRILAFEMVRENALEVVASAPTELMDVAFRTIIQNRVAHGGIIAPGGGVLKGGDAGRGVASRWYPDTLANRICALADARDRITVVQKDALALMASVGDDSGTATFIDPPYTAGGKNAGSRLYTHNIVNHEEVFRLASLLSDPVLTYDLNPEVQALANRYGLQAKPIAMKTTHHAVMDELLIGKELLWDTPDAPSVKTRRSRRTTAKEPVNASAVLVPY